MSCRAGTGNRCVNVFMRSFQSYRDYISRAQVIYRTNLMLAKTLAKHLFLYRETNNLVQKCVNTINKKRTTTTTTATKLHFTAL